MRFGGPMSRTPSNELDETLKQLAIAAQGYSPGSPERQFALTQLVNGILRSSRLCHPQRGQFLSLYQDIYNEVIQKLFLYICENIDRYDPERGTVMAWVNVLLERRFFKDAIPDLLGCPNVQKITLADLDNIAVPQNAPTLMEVVKEWVAVWK
jgi:hypothetical protein